MDRRLGVWLCGLLFVARCGGDAHPSVYDPTAGAGFAGASGTGGTGGGAGFAGVGATGGTGGFAGGGAAAEIDCMSDSECPSNRCVEIVPGGFRTCFAPTPEATACTGNSEDECCASADCAGLHCYSSNSYPVVGPPQPEFNVCERPGCATTADCGQQQACFPAGTLGHPVGQCESALCGTDAECTLFTGGRCLPVQEECWGRFVMLACVYPQDGCRRNADCSNAKPPFTVGMKYCDRGSCTEVLQGTICGG